MGQLLLINARYATTHSYKYQYFFLRFPIFISFQNQQQQKEEWNKIKTLFANAFYVFRFFFFFFIFCVCDSLSFSFTLWFDEAEQSARLFQSKPFIYFYPLCSTLRIQTYSIQKFESVCACLHNRTFRVWITMLKKPKFYIIFFLAKFETWTVKFEP